MTQIQKFQSMAEIANFVKENSQMLYFEDLGKQQKFMSNLVLDIYNDSRLQEGYAAKGIDLMDVITLHYRAADLGLSYIKGDFSIVKFGGKNPRPQIFTSYKREREDVLNSEMVAEFYPQTVYNGSKVIQRDTLDWQISPQQKSARKLNAQGQFDLTNVMGFAFTLVTTSGKRYTYFTTKEEIFFEIGKEEKMLFMYKSANGEMMFYKFVMRKLLKWLPISLSEAKKWQDAEIVPNLPLNEPTQPVLGNVGNFAEKSAFKFIEPSKPEPEEKTEPKQPKKPEPQPKAKEKEKPTLTTGSDEFQNILERIAAGKVTSVEQLEEEWNIPNDVRTILNEAI